VNQELKSQPQTSTLKPKENKKPQTSENFRRRFDRSGNRFVRLFRLFGRRVGNIGRHQPHRIRRVRADLLIYFLRISCRATSWRLSVNEPYKLNFSDTLPAVIIGEALSSLLPLGILISGTSKAVAVRKPRSAGRRLVVGGDGKSFLFAGDRAFYRLRRVRLFKKLRASRRLGFDD
jgi:hypothetical protein